MCIALIVVCINYANQKSNYVTFGNVFGYGFKTTAIIALITVVYSLLSIYVIFPETRDLALEQSRKQMEQQGRLSEDQIDGALETVRKGFLLIVLLSAIFGTLIFGAISSVLGAAFAKKKPVTPFDQPRT
jgi:preprotein translocase subunit SecF